jgi:HD superfamily phosphohydrolase
MGSAADILKIPEVAGLDARGGLIRIPPELDVPLTPRVRRLIDTPQFRRLAKVGQLGLVSLVYPGAVHSRFEHALGVYRLGLLFLKRLAHDRRFAEAVTPRDAELLIAAALLHDIGHWPFCHAIEDLRLASVPTHEEQATKLLAEPELADALREDWGLEPAEVAALLCAPAPGPATELGGRIGNPSYGSRASHILASLLSGPIDIDKMDYLARDSLHAGVPYGRNFDQGRLIGSLCLNAAGDGLAITDKGKTAAEMMVFSRYVMFSEVYWHHGVRAATAMLVRAFYLLHGQLNLDETLRANDDSFVEQLWQASGHGVGDSLRESRQLAERVDHTANAAGAAELLGGLFGPQRRLYKRVAQFSIFEQPELYDRLARRPYPWLVACAEQFAAVASAALGEPISAHEILFDAPPQEREVQFRVEVFSPKEDRYRWLEEVSPVVRTLAREQFDDYVKRVRLFAPGHLAGPLRDRKDLTKMLEQAIDSVAAARVAGAEAQGKPRQKC